ncbi:MAG TPA: pyridoxamine 5'-phosphate oxidase family protein [Candidatus Omnitrophica bacterium]|nr:pyridoxamine 5'-phosphate oxidase family protein [Candidatus Omnitrophota bacterium]
MLSPDVIHFFKNASFSIVTTLDVRGGLHNSCKGIVKVKPNGDIYLLDLYKRQTFKNLQHNSKMSVTGVDEHKFTGYSLKGEGRIAEASELGSDIIAAWEAKITSRITQRVINSIQGKKGHPAHPEALLPKPEYLIVMKTKQVVELTPTHLK